MRLLFYCDNLLYVVFHLLPERSVDGHADRHKQDYQHEHDDERDEADVDQAADSIENQQDDRGEYSEYEDDEEHRPFAAVGSVVRSLDGLHRVLAFFDQEIVGQRPCDREHDARDDHEDHGDVDGNDHQAHGDQEFTHVTAVLAVEDSQRIDYFAFGKLRR